MYTYHYHFVIKLQENNQEKHGQENLPNTDKPVYTGFISGFSLDRVSFQGSVQTGFISGFRLDRFHFRVQFRQDSFLGSDQTGFHFRVQFRQVSFQGSDQTGFHFRVSLYYKRAIKSSKNRLLQLKLFFINIKLKKFSLVIYSILRMSITHRIDSRVLSNFTERYLSTQSLIY